MDSVNIQLGTSFFWCRNFPGLGLVNFPKSWFKKTVCSSLFFFITPPLIVCFPVSLLVIASTAKWVHSAEEPRCHCTSRTHHIFSILPWLFAMALNLLQSPADWWKSAKKQTGLFRDIPLAPLVCLHTPFNEEIKIRSAQCCIILHGYIAVRRAWPLCPCSGVSSLMPLVCLTAQLDSMSDYSGR